MFNRHLGDRRLGMLLGIVLQLRLEFRDPALRFLFVNLSSFKLTRDFIKKSLKESLHSPSPFRNSMPGK